MIATNKITATVCVTGANRGIGLGLVSLLLEEGHNVYATTRHLSRSNELTKLKKLFPDQLSILEVDVCDPKSIDYLASHFTSKSLELLINNAGILLSDRTDQGQMNWENIEESFAINTIGAMRVTEALLPSIKRAKNPKVISISSQLGSIGDNGSGAQYGYRMSKAALNMWNRSFSKDYPEIVATVIHPGWVKTDMGGEKAPTPIDESCRGILKVVGSLDLSKSGHFYDFRGKTIPW